LCIINDTIINTKSIFKYTLENGKIPFDEWFNTLDKPIKAKIIVRLERLKLGLLGNYRNLKNNVTELKFQTGERIYFYSENNSIVILLLTAGNKQRQKDDISRAYEYLNDYKERNLKC